MFDERWEPAEGILIDTRYGGKHGDRSGNASMTAHYLMEVRPLSGADPFRCECEPPSLMISFKSPPVNVPVKMECLPARKKARFDRNDPAISKTSPDITSTEQHDQSVYRVEFHADVSRLDRRSLNQGEQTF
jgi:hypothetical protein